MTEIICCSTYVADINDVSNQGWSQYGSDVYSPTTSVSSCVVNDRIYVGVFNKTIGKASTRWRKAIAPVVPPEEPEEPVWYEAVFIADGETIAKVSFKEGDTALGSVPKVPEKTGHTGKWAEYELGKANLTIMAEYEANTYQITFKNWNNTTLSSKRYLFGADIVAPPEPSRPRDGYYEYRFTGWSPALAGKVDQDRNMIYTAQYSKSFHIKEGVYDIQSALSGSKFLDISAASLGNGANVQLYARNYTAAQRYKVKQNSDKTYSIINVNSSKALDAQWGGKSNGTNAQKFKFLAPDSAGVAAGATYTVGSSLNKSKVLDIAGASKSNEANLQLYASNGTNAQKFKFNRDTNGYYTLMCSASGRALDVQWAGSANGTNVWQYSTNNTFAQKWMVVKNADGTVSFVNARSGMYLDVSGAKAANGTNIHIWTGNATKAQKFFLQKV